MRDQLGNACTILHIWEVELHVSCIFLEFFKELFRRGTHDIVDLDHLIELIVTWEKWEKR